MSSKHIQKFECNVCKKTFSKKNNLNDHITAKHSNFNKFVCSQCSKSFAYKQSLNRHMNVKHKVTISMYSCSECGYSSQLKFMLTRHIKNVHQSGNYNPLNMSCVFCNHHCSKSNMSTHYVLCHQTQIVSEKLKFDNLEDFFAWKYEIEEQDISRFVYDFFLLNNAINKQQIIYFLDLLKLVQLMLVFLDQSIYFLNVIVMENTNQKGKI